MALEYALWGYLTYKADSYSFGVVVLEIVAGMNNVKYRLGEEYVCLLDWAFVLQRKGSLMELMDPKLGSNFNQKEAMRVVKIALLCTNPSPALRPTMSAVLGMLQGHISVQEAYINPSIYGDELMLQSLETNIMRFDPRTLLRLKPFFNHQMQHPMTLPPHLPSSLPPPFAGSVQSRSSYSITKQF
ncbi:hypothetical protein RJ639_015903 [Escallonia herrerae]|uniref:Serine-threonine/tyrosine-protein kinase catalytic domain-containing protein n=1 Tax=Escallonia herrerae TaxID=1293975 RepID=A0AA88VHM5_9ASTE|nr:hypothetical protein RJ639_015903 [Escallonia herrerae]